MTEFTEIIKNLIKPEGIADFDHAVCDETYCNRTGVLWMGGTEIGECKISAISDRQATVSCPYARSMPAAFDLIDAVTASIYHVRKAWCSEQNMEVEIVGREVLAIV